MIIGALKTTSPTDKRSVLHPETISSLVNLEGVKVIFESGIGQGINVSDSEFEKNNLTSVSRHNCLSEADVLIVLNLLSSPALCILMNKNTPSLIVHIEINKTKIRFPKFSEID